MITLPIMNKHTSRRSFASSGAFSLVALSSLAFAISLGCGKSEAAPNKSAAAESVSVVGANRAETENYIAEIKASGEYKAGAEGVVEVTLTTKGDYHINKQYPYKFKAADPAPEGVTYPKPVLTRDSGTFDEKKGSFKVPFTVAKAGKATIGGTFYLSVCSDANCIMDKVALDLTVDMK